VSGLSLLAHATTTRGWGWGEWGHEPFVVLSLAVVAALCARGASVRGQRVVRGLTQRGEAKRSPRPNAVGRGRRAALAGGLVVAALALVSPLQALSGMLFSAHMVQHLLLMLVAAPLLVIGRPGRAMLMALPQQLRRSAVSRAFARAGHRIGRLLTRPFVAWIVFTIALWAWHLPAAYDAALQSEPIHGVEHLCFLGAAMLAWSVVLRERAGVGLGALGRALFLLVTALQSGLLGALLLFARTPLYPVHGLGPASWGLTPLEDQQLAGAIMWIPPGAVYLLVSAVLLLRWFRSMDARLRPHGVAAEWGRR
jgi:putative membrane protein